MSTEYSHGGFNDRDLTQFLLLGQMSDGGLRRHRHSTRLSGSIQTQPRRTEHVDDPIATKKGKMKRQSQLRQQNWDDMQVLPVEFIPAHQIRHR